MQQDKSLPAQNKLPSLRRERKRVLLVNCYFDDTRYVVPRTLKLPKPMGIAYMAGAFSPQLCHVRVHCEMFSGPLEDPELLSWPDMIVLTGLTTALDRMKHITAYARTMNRNVIVVAGGSAIRMFPGYSQGFFDYCCLGDIEQMSELVAGVWGPDYASEEMLPRFDLAYWIGRVAHLESSRYCNFKCSFCTITAEGRGYQKYDLNYIRRQILAWGHKKRVVFIDNNFYGNDRSYFLQRVDLLKQMHGRGELGNWATLVTSDFFFRDDNLSLAREAGCGALFSGVESFNSEWLRSVNKMQNVVHSPVELIRKCLDAEIVFLYGLMLDVTARSVESLQSELDFIVNCSEITLPAYLSFPIPYPGTPFFKDCLVNDRLLPRTKVRDLDSTTLCIKPLDPVEKVCEFIRDVQSLNGSKTRVLRHGLKFFKRYRKVLNNEQLQLALANGLLLCAYPVTSGLHSISRLRKPQQPRTHLSTTEGLDAVYQPAFRVDSRYADYFVPTMLTDDGGQIAKVVTDDISSRETGQHTSAENLVGLST